MPLIEGTSAPKTYTAPKPKPRRTTSYSNPGEIAVVNRPSTTSPLNPGEIANSNGWSPSPLNPGEIAIANTPKPSPLNPGEIAVINSGIASSGGTGAPSGGGGFGTPGSRGDDPLGVGKQTSSTDSEAQKKQAEEDAAMEAAKTAADEALERQLAAIEAEFGMTREELMRDEGEAGRQYRQALAGLLLQRDANIEASMNEMIERGIIQSGITLQRQNDIQEQFAREQAASSGDLDYRRAAIAAERAALPTREEHAKAAAKAEHERVLRDLELMRAAAAGGV